MLVHIDLNQHSSIEEFLKGINERNLHFYASDLQQRLGLKALSEVEEAVRRAMNACRSQRLPLEEHFKPIYRCQESKTILDWKLSGLGYGMVLLNSNPAHPLVSQLQLSLLHKEFRFTSV